MVQINRGNYFYVTNEKETMDTNKLVSQIRDSGWISPELILINCSPDYSSRVTQILNHGLSYLNNNELYEVRDLNMPYPNMVQVWDQEDRCYKQYIRYLADWARRNISSGEKYIFVDSGTLRGVNFTRLRSIIKGKVDEDSYRFATLYLQDNSIFTPDFYVEKFNKEKQGGLLFEWENVNNPNWDY